MKSFSFFLLTILVSMGTTLFAQGRTDSFIVYGNCGMCKKRIEKAVKDEAVSFAAWDANTKFLKITYDSSTISNDELQKRIALVGHDTEKYEAEDAVYGKLPGCCLYERKNRKGKDKELADHY